MYTTPVSVRKCTNLKDTRFGLVLVLGSVPTYQAIKLLLNLLSHV